MKHGRSRKKRNLHALWFLLPALIVYTTFMIAPIITSMVQSLYAFDANRTLSFVWFQNYKTLLTDAAWSGSLWNALWNSAKFFLINMFIQNPLALFLAVLLAGKTRCGNAYRTILYLPCILSLVMVAFVWQMMLNPTWGIVRDMLQAVGLGSLFQPWLGQKQTALTTMSLISAWQNLGVPVLLYYSALISIPGELIEASRVDGCTKAGTFWRIKLPMVMPMVATVSLLTYIYNFNAFDLIYAIKGPMAGPDFSTDTMMSFFFRTFYGHQLQQPNAPMGATVACVILMLMLGGVLLYLAANKAANKRIN
jgi:raffinose/stachyose/melibiose transport system permease protein